MYMKTTMAEDVVCKTELVIKGHLSDYRPNADNIKANF